MKKAARDKKALPLGQAALGELIDEITTDAYGEDEQLWAFRQAFEDSVTLPAEGTVVGEPVLVIAFDYDGNERRGLTVKVRCADGREHVVAAADVTMPTRSEGARHLAAYRKWMGLTPSRPAVPRAFGTLSRARPQWSGRTNNGFTPAIRIYPARSNLRGSMWPRWAWSC